MFLMCYCIRFGYVLLSVGHQGYFVVFFLFHLFIFIMIFIYYWFQSEAGFIECIQKNCFLLEDGDNSLNVLLNLMMEPPGSGLFFVTGFFQLIQSHYIFFERTICYNEPEIQDSTETEQLTKRS